MKFLIQKVIPLNSEKKVPSIPKGTGKRGGLHVDARGGRGVLLAFLIILISAAILNAQNTYSVSKNKTKAKSVIPLTHSSSEGMPSAKGGQDALNQYLQEAAQNNPKLKGRFQEYLAALQQVPQVTALPDPETAFGYFIRSTETRVGPQQARISLTQMFPWFGTLGARGDVATQMGKAKFETFQETRNNLFFKVKKTWYALYHTHRSIRIIEENIDILETFESLATTRYETAQVSQVDILRVQIDKEDLIARAALLQDSKKALLQRLAELVNRPESLEPDIPDTLVAQELPLPLPELKQKILQQNPRLVRLNFETASARSAIEVAQKEGWPKFGLGADYIFTGEREAALAGNGKDAIVGRVGIQIPLYRKKYRAQEKQARLQMQAVQNRQIDAQNSLLTTVEETLRDFFDARRRISLYKDIQIQRTRQALDILTEEYTTAATDFEELLRLQRKLLEYQLARDQATVDQNTAVAFIEYLYGKYNVNPEGI